MINKVGIIFAWLQQIEWMKLQLCPFTNFPILRLNNKEKNHFQGLEDDNFSALSDWKTHIDLIRKKKSNAPHQLSSRMEDLRSDLKIPKYKDSIILPAFERALLISRDSAFEKVVKNNEKENRINIPIPYNPRLPDYGSIIKQNWNYMIQKNPELKKVMPPPPYFHLVISHTNQSFPPR